MILATYRDTELDVSRPLARTLEELTRRRLSARVDLKCLGKSEVATMLAGAGKRQPPGALVDALYLETEGNPFFVREVYEYWKRKDVYSTPAASGPQSQRRRN